MRSSGSVGGAGPGKTFETPDSTAVPKALLDPAGCWFAIPAAAAGGRTGDCGFPGVALARINRALALTEIPSDSPPTNCLRISVTFQYILLVRSV